MQYDHIISNMVYSMGFICWYLFSSMGGYIFILLIYIFCKRIRLFLYIMCILVLCAFLPVICGKTWPVIRMSHSFQQCVRHTVFGLRNINKNESYIFAVSPHGIVPLCAPFLFHILQEKIKKLYYSVADILLLHPK